MDRSLWLEILFKTGISKQTASCFAHYLTSRMQSVQRGGVSSTFLEITKGVAQGSVLGPILFTIYGNDLCANLSNASDYFYVVDSVICCGPHLIAQAYEFLQSAFDAVLIHLGKLKLVLQSNVLHKVICSFPRRTSLN